nr:hypothetical protein [Tanacetum cinerariifolium]
LAPTTLGEAFSIARFETIAGKKLNIEEKIDIVLSCPSEEAPPVINGSLDANEDIGVVEVSSVIDDVFDIGESNVQAWNEACGVGEDELNRVISALKDGGGEFDGRLDEINLNLSEELADNGVSPIPTSLVAHESPRNHKFVQPNVWGWMSDSQSTYSSYHLEGKVIFKGVGSVTAWVGKGERMVFCYVQGSGRWKRKKGVGYGSGRQENHGSGRRDCRRIRIWDPRIKRVSQDNTLRTSAYNFKRSLFHSPFKMIAVKKLNIKEKIDIVISCPSEEAQPVINGSVDANEDICVVEELADNGVSPIPTSLVAHESPRVRQLWEIIGIGDAHWLMDNGRKHKFSQPNVRGWMSESQSPYSSYHLERKVIFEGAGSVTAWVGKGGRMMLCYVQGSGRRKRKKGVGCDSGRQENHESGRRDCRRIRIWDPRIKRVSQDNTLRTRWF